jgi:hypothetical protein
MLELSNLKIEGIEKMFNKTTRKMIRFSYSNNRLYKENSIITSKNKCTFVNEATIKWE